MNTVRCPDLLEQHNFAITPIPWEQFKTEVLAMYQPPHVAKTTRTKVVQIIRHLEELGIQTTTDLTPSLIARYCTAREGTIGAWTLRSHLMTVRVLCSLAEASGYLRASPFRIRKLSQWVKAEPLEGRRHYTREELKKLLEVLQKDVDARRGWAQWRARRLQAVVAIAAYCGLRKMEILTLHLEDIDVELGIIDLKHRGKRLKTSASAQIVPMPDALIEILRSWMSHRMDAPFGYPLPKDCPWFIPTLNRKSAWLSGSVDSRVLAQVKAVGRRVGIDDLNLHGLRRSLATHLEFHGCGEAGITRILRHTSMQTTRKFYRRADAANLREMTKGLQY